MYILVRAPEVGEALGPAKTEPPSERDCWGEGGNGGEGEGYTHKKGGIRGMFARKQGKGITLEM